MLGYLSLALSSYCAAAAVLTAPTATITAQPALDKRAVTTVGFYSTGSEDGTTLWGTVTVQQQGRIVATSGSQFAICATDTCRFGTCSAGTYIIGSTTTPCGAASSVTCSSNLLYQDVFDTAPLTNFWCDSPTETGYVMYKKTPTDGSSLASATITPSASSNDSGNDSTSSPHSTASSTSSTVSTSPSPTPTPKPTHVGAIVGGVIGGVAVIGALVVAAIFLIRRGRASPQTPAQPAYTAHPPQQETKPYAGIAVAPPPEKTPAGTTYPYAVEVGSAPAPPQSPVPQYTPNNGAINELPTQRM